ncbi:hypothetical protein KIL84_004359 [Mauremys mutica]|uniref:Uncharacterized protein n=1 Tax=Mauremys mutica TaxID=74926 RepID=A0A9D3XNG0_9SAUR|nr:hypothetical protein KIL84_004359 [Mauremys mutica]
MPRLPHQPLLIVLLQSSPPPSAWCRPSSPGPTCSSMGRSSAVDRVSCLSPVLLPGLLRTAQVEEGQVTAALLGTATGLHPHTCCQAALRARRKNPSPSQRWAQGTGFGPSQHGEKGQRRLPPRSAGVHLWHRPITTGSPGW